MRERLQRWHRRHGAFVLVLLLFISFRLLAILTLRTGGFVADFSDYDFYATWGELTHMGYTTFENLWTAYPPLFAALMLPVFELSSRIPPWIEPRLWFHVLFGLLLLLFESGNLVLVYRLAARLDVEDALSVRRPNPAQTEPVQPPYLLTPIPGLTAAILYALLFIPAYTLLGWFEPLPLFFLLLGLDLLLLHNRWAWIGSACAAALGFLIKLTPMLLVPLAIRHLGAKLSWRAAREEWFKPGSPGNLLRPALYVAIFAGVVLSLGYVLVGGRTELALSSLTINRIRPPWQSIWALLDGYYGYGLVPLDMRNLTKLDQPLWESRLPWARITLAFVALYLWLYSRRYDWDRVRTPVAFAGVSILWLFLYSKGWSPQFLVWVLTFLVLLMPGLRGIAYAIVLSLISVTEAYVFLILLPNEEWLMNGTVILRTLLLVVLAVEWLAQIWPKEVRAARMARFASVAGWTIMAVAVAAALLAVPPAAAAYQERRFAELSCHEAVSYLLAETDSGTESILTEEIELWREFYPWLRGQYMIRVLDSYSPIDEAPEAVIARQLDGLLSEGEAWWLQRSASIAAATYFQRDGVNEIAPQAFGPCSLSRIKASAENALAVVDTVGGPIVLEDAVIKISTPSTTAEMGEALNVVLYWQAEAAVEESYTVFTQLFAPDGTMVAQQDNLPVNGLAPTDTWQPGTLVRDPYRLVLPDGAPSGEYQLQIGLYDTNGRRSLTPADSARADYVNADYIELPIVIGQ